MSGGTSACSAARSRSSRSRASSAPTQVDSGLNKLLEKWGVTMENRIVGRRAVRPGAACRRRSASQIPVPYPPVPVVTFDEEQAEHPVAFRLAQVPMPFGAPLKLNGELKGDKDVKRTVLARTSKSAWLWRATASTSSRATARLGDAVQRGPYAVAVAIEGKLPSAFAAGGRSSSAEGGARAGPRGPARGREARARARGRPAASCATSSCRPPRRGQRAGPQRRGRLRAQRDRLAGAGSELIAIRAKSVEEPMLEVPANVKEAEDEIKTAAKEGDESQGQGGVRASARTRSTDWDAKKARIKLLNIGADAAAVGRASAWCAGRSARRSAPTSRSETIGEKLVNKNRLLIAIVVLAMLAGARR